MRSVAAVVLILVALQRVSAAGPPKHLNPTPQSNPSIEFLLTSAATDFHAHGHPAGVRFVRAAYTTAADGAKQYRLCGEFLPDAKNGKAQWTPFATVQTSGYEQWLGGQSGSYCSGSSMTWEKGDWTPALQSRLDALKQGAAK